MLFFKLNVNDRAEGNFPTIRKKECAADTVDPFRDAGDSLITAAVLFFVRLKVGHAHHGLAGKHPLKALQFRIDLRNFTLVQLDALSRQAARLGNG